MKRAIRYGIVIALGFVGYAACAGPGAENSGLRLGDIRTDSVVVSVKHPEQAHGNWFVEAVN